MSKQTRFRLIYLVLFIVAVFVIFSSFMEKLDPKEDQITFPQKYEITTPLIPKNIEFCGELVPLNNFEVYERLEREIIVNTYWHSLTLLTIKRANRWFPIIEPILEAYNIPDDFKYLCITESTMLNLTSPAKAVGFWQFLKSAAIEYGLEVNREIDERYHVEKSTAAACRYLQDAYEKYGNWTMAAAAYNMGMNGISEQLERQATRNYYNLVLGEETSRYVLRIIATKITMLNPENYSFNIDESDLYKPFQTYEVKVDSSISNWAAFAKSYGLNYKILKLYNPWLRESYLTNKNRKEYTLKLPVEGSIDVISE